MRIEFDVFDDGHLSMWTHFNHGSDFNKVRESLIAVRDHLSQFIDDKEMCPFHRLDK